MIYDETVCVYIEIKYSYIPILFGMTLCGKEGKIA